MLGVFCSSSFLQKQRRQAAKSPIRARMMKDSLRKWARDEEKRRGIQDGKDASSSPSGRTDFPSRSIHPLAGEFVGHRLMNLVGIRTAPSLEVVHRDEACQRNLSRWVVKTMIGRRLKAQFLKPWLAEWVLMVEQIPRSISLFYLRKFYSVAAEKPFSMPHSPIEERLSPIWAFTTTLWLGKCQVPNAREFYSDFRPPADWSAVRRAIAWDSDQALAIHAARFFLSATTAHSSNLLVDAEGNLSTIDFEYCARTLGDELEKLFENVIPGTRAFEALRPVSELRNWDVRGLFDDLPEWVEWPLGNQQATVEHYLSRLAKWKKLFSERGGREPSCCV